MDISNIDFGTRRCKLCRQDIPAQIFGRHVLGVHGSGAIALRWPGGTAGYLRDCVESLDESIERASGHPQVQANLKRQRDYIAGLVARAT